MAAGFTHTPIATTTLASAAASYTFSSISGSYTDLVLVMSGQSVQATTYDNLVIQFNGDTATNYSRTRLNGYSAGGATDRSLSTTSHLIGPITGTSYSSSIFSPSITHIMNYSNATTYKPALYRSNSQDGYVQLGVALWRSTSAITSILIKTLSGSNLATGSTFTLYGILAA